MTSASPKNGWQRGIPENTFQLPGVTGLDICRSFLPFDHGFQIFLFMEVNQNDRPRRKRLPKTAEHKPMKRRVVKNLTLRCNRKPLISKQSRKEKVDHFATIIMPDRGTKEALATKLSYLMVENWAKAVMLLPTRSTARYVNQVTNLEKARLPYWTASKTDFGKLEIVWLFTLLKTLFHPGVDGDSSSDRPGHSKFGCLEIDAQIKRTAFVHWIVLHQFPVWNSVALGSK